MMKIFFRKNNLFFYNCDLKTIKIKSKKSTKTECINLKNIQN
eukprot:UN13263